jgi:hypothetical protein
MTSKGKVKIEKKGNKFRVCVWAIDTWGNGEWFPIYGPYDTEDEARPVARMVADNG